MTDNEQKQQPPTSEAAARFGAPVSLSDIDFEKMSMEEIYERTFTNIAEGEVVKGRILQITGSEVLVDVGYKSEGIIPRHEFGDTPLKAGDLVDVYLEKTEDTEGLIVLSKEKADKIKIWDQINHAYENDEILEGRVVERIKGGLTVDIGVKAFLPGSQIDLRPVRDLEKLLGENLRVKVIKLNKKRGNIVLSRRVILEQEREEKKKETLDRLREGAVLTGVVKNITEYGAFIDLGGIDGLLHITDMSWGRINHPSEMFNIGQDVEVMVLKFDPETEKVSLGLKQKSEDPWERAAQKYPISSKVRGKVISLTDYGAFVELEQGIEGLIHISEMSWTGRVKHPSKIVSIGQEIEVMVLNIDVEQKRISLGLKQTEPNPWFVVQERYPVGSIVKGKVRNFTNFGAFVELEEGIDGLIHISDMSWTSRVKHPSEIFKKGQEVEAVLLDIDPEAERLSLGLKQLSPDPWDEVSRRFYEGQVVEGEIVRLSEFGAFVRLMDGIEGLIHISELDESHVEKPEDVVQIGQNVKMKIIKIDIPERKISLSIRAFKASEDTDLSEYMGRQESSGPTFGDVINRETLLRSLRQMKDDKQ
jgi:small subunit ribosomal protein S1